VGRITHCLRGWMDTLIESTFAPGYHLPHIINSTYNPFVIMASLPPRRGTPLTPRVEPSPPHRRRTSPPLKDVGSFMFTGLHPLYRREVIQSDHDHMIIYCNQLGCTDFKPRVVNRTLSGTNNYKPHYKRFHPDIPTSAEEARKQ
jgi:hypothetical protein